MTILEAIHRVDALRHNVFTQEEKIGWLAQVDGLVTEDLIRTHEAGEGQTFRTYDAETPLEQQLLVPAPYDDLYLRWMEAMIDFHNGEYGKYNNAVDMFNTSYAAFQNYYNRTHMPKGKQFKYF